MLFTGFFSRLCVPETYLSILSYGVPASSQKPLPSPGPVPLTDRLGLSRVFRKRDTCADALGPGRSNQICPGSSTLCCLDLPNAYPQCQPHFGAGWCVVSSNLSQNAFVDTASDCTGRGAVHCTELAPGVTQACCPASTICTPGYKASQNFVRCEMPYGDLLKADGQGPSSSTSIPSSSQIVASTQTSITSSVPPSTTQVASPVLPQTSPTNSVTPAGPTSLPAGEIAGIVIGAVLGAGIFALLAVLVWRRRKQSHLPAGARSPWVRKKSTASRAGVAIQELGADSWRAELDISGRPKGFVHPSELSASREPQLPQELP